MLRLLAQREQGYEDIAALMGLSVDQVRSRVKESLAEIDGPLSEDQKAMLRLLAQREQGYEDIAALMGLSVDQVRSRVKESLAEIGRAGGNSDEAEAPSEPTPSEAAHPESAPATAPGGSVEGAESGHALRDTEGSGGTEARPQDAKTASLQRATRLHLPKDQRLLAVALGGAVALILVLILVLSGGGSSGSSASTSASTIPTTPTKSNSGSTKTASNSKLTEAVLSPVNGGSASGRALFGRIHSTPVLQVEARGLSPSPPGQSYTVWLYRSPKLVLRVGAVSVGKTGGIAAQFPIPTQLLAYVASGAFNQIDISLTANSAYKDEVAKAKREKRLPQYTGTDILRGTITGPAVKK